jgi:hypothetical protein
LEANALSMEGCASDPFGDEEPGSCCVDDSLTPTGTIAGDV